MAYAVLPSSVRKASSPVLASSRTRSRGSSFSIAANAAPTCCALSSTVDPSGRVTVTRSGEVLPPLPTVLMIALAVSVPGWPGSPKSIVIRSLTVWVTETPATKTTAHSTITQRR